MRSRRQGLSPERLRELLHYDPLTGVFRWRVNRSPKVRAGDIAGTPSTRGYVTITADYVAYAAHQLAWLYMTGEWALLLDHRDCCTSNNVFSNLRKATLSQNGANRRRSDKRKLDLPKGVTYCRSTERYRAQIYIRRRRIVLGHFREVEPAAAAYWAAAQRIFGEFARAA